MPDVEKLIAQLTPEEKARMVSGESTWTIPGCERLDIPAWTVSDGPIGVRGRARQPSACFPSASAIAATFDCDLVRELGVAIGEEARAKSVQMVLGPTVNIHRHPLAGRHFECYSEDPHLSARTAVSYIEGVQSTGVGSCVKHFVANDQEHERMTISADVGERPLREIYLVPFEAAVREAGVWSVMGAYNFVNGSHACAHSELLQRILKDEWGFPGLVMSDWGALKETVGPARNGLDLEMPGPGRFFGHGRLLEAVRAGEVDEAAVDEKVRRILGFLEWCGALDEHPTGEEQPVDRPEHRVLARRVATQSIVLLKNDRRLLPLVPSALRSIALIGPNAATMAALGGGSATVYPYYTVSVLDALRQRLGDAVEVRHASGCSIRRGLTPLDPAHLGPGAVTVEIFDPVDPGASVWSEAGRGPLNVFTGDNWPTGIGDAPSFQATATFTPPQSGTWRLAAGGLHHARLLVDGQPVADNHTPDTFSAGFGIHAGAGLVELEAGRPVELELRYRPVEGTQLAVFTIGAELVGDTEPERAELLRDAQLLAGGADVAVVVVGTSAEWESEGSDRTSLGLPGDQDELVRRVATSNRRTVVVHNAGAPMAMPWLDEVGAVLQVWYPGQEGGNAITDVLIGDADPGGRMPTTWPRRLEDTPAYTNYPGENGHVLYGEGLFVGYRWYDARDIEPLWPFGHGLSYATFGCGELALSETEVDAGPSLHVEVRMPVTNTSDRPGSAVLQCYVAPQRPRLPRPPQELKGYAKLRLGPSETAVALVTLDHRSFAYWDDARSAWVTDPGDYEIRLGRSSRDIIARALVTLTAAQSG